MGGAGAFYSVNYDNRFSAKTKLGYRVGLALVSGDGLFILTPIQINYVSSRDYGIEFGVGVTPYIPIRRKFPRSSGDAGLSPTITLAYRFKTKKLINFRAGFTTLTDAGLAFPLNIFWPTLSIGRQF